MTTTLSLKPKQVVKNLLKALPVHARDIITSVIVSGETRKKMTLDAIGKRYGITRERVRQIEDYALGDIQKSNEYGRRKRPSRRSRNSSNALAA